MSHPHLRLGLGLGFRFRFLLLVVPALLSSGSGSAAALETNKNAKDFEDISPLPTVFETSSLPTDEDGNLLPRYMASVGNGHLATTLYTDTVYMNGLYNGERGESHRARVPSRNNLRVDKTSLRQLSNERFALDVGKGTFFERFATENFTAELRTFAHRFYHKVIVSQIELTGLNGSAAAFNYNLQFLPEADSGKISADLNLGAEEEYTDAGAGGVAGSFQCGATKQIEDPRYQMSPSTICILTTQRPEELVGQGVGSKLFTYFTAYDVDLDGASNDFNKVAQLSRSSTPEEVFNSHVTAWEKMWSEGRIEVEGNVPLAKIMYGCLYYLLNSLPISTETNSPVGQFYGLSPGGLAYGDYLSDYQGHSFWDTETWMYPTILYFYPDLAKQILNYRLHALPAARDRANETGYKGSRFPWESGYTGREVTPDCCPETRDFQIHNTGDIGFAIRQYISFTRDETWLKSNNNGNYVTNGCGIIREIAEFWASRASFDPATKQYDINGVMPPDEDHHDVNNSIYTNVVAGYAIFFAEYAECLCGDSMEGVPEDWIKTAKALTFLYDSTYDYHPEFEGYAPWMTIKQADVVLLGFPLLYPMNSTTRKNDLLLYEQLTRENGPAMTWAMHTVGFLELNELEQAAGMFNKSYQPYMREPFKVWTEARAPDFGAINFITGMGGFLQEVVSGYGGLRLYPERIEFDRPRLLPATTGLNLRGIKYLGNIIDLEVSSSREGEASFILVSSSAEFPLEISYTVNGASVTGPFVSVGQEVVVSTNGTTLIRTKTSSGCPLPTDKIGGIVGE